MSLYVFRIRRFAFDTESAVIGMRASIGVVNEAATKALVVQGGKFTDMAFVGEGTKIGHIHSGRFW